MMAAAGIVLLGLVAIVTAVSPNNLVPSGFGPNHVLLGTAAKFAILSKTGVSTTGATAITGDVGVSPIAQTAMTGFGLVAKTAGTCVGGGAGSCATSAVVTGLLWAASDTSPTDVKMTTAVSDMETAYTNAAGRKTPDFVEYETGALGGTTLLPGLYNFSTGVKFTGDCTIKGSPQDTWIFQVAGDMTMDDGKQIILADGAKPENIVWVVAGRSIFGTTSHFKGIILGATLAEFKTGSSIDGRVLVQNAVTLDATTVVQPP